MPGTFSPPPQVSYPNMHHGTCVTHVPWCMPGSLISGFLWRRWGKRTLHSRRMRNPQFCVSGKRSIATTPKLPSPSQTVLVTTPGHVTSSTFSNMYTFINELYTLKHQARWMIEPQQHQEHALLPKVPENMPLLFYFKFWCKITCGFIKHQCQQGLCMYYINVWRPFVKHWFTYGHTDVSISQESRTHTHIFQDSIPGTWSIIRFSSCWRSNPRWHRQIYRVNSL